MILNKEQFSSCFNLLRSVLFEAFQTEVLFYTPPYKDLSQIDQGIRSVIWPNFNIKDESLLPSIDNPERRIFIIRSNLGFYNIIVYMNYAQQPDFISIGPFRSEEITLDVLQQYTKEGQISPLNAAALQTFFESIPSVPLQGIINVTKQILSSFFPEFEICLPVYAEFSGQVHNIQLDSQMLQDFSADFSVAFQDSLFKMLEALSKGQFENTISYMKEYLRASKILNDRNISNCQHNMHILNDHCLLVVLNTNVHPVHTLKLYLSLKAKINAINNRESLLNMPNDILHKYCLLIKNYAFPDYSKTVRSVVNYIHMHLEEDLTLSMLAKEFNKNASSLSAAFSKEVGLSVTNYIHQARINEAIKLFNTTKMSISEAAFAVGFHDFAYFSRLFHKQVGCSPREYCKSIR